MLLHIRNVLSASQVPEFQRELGVLEWIDGRATAGHLSSLVKDNLQIREDHPVGRKLGGIILDALERHPVFMSGALPVKVVPPLFNRHAGGQSYGRHVDGSVRPVAGSSMRVRTDLSATLFLSDPADYDGGELTIEDATTDQRIKLPAGDMILYPGTSVHRVEPVTKGIRYASFFWIQSMVREDSRRKMLFDLDSTIQQLTVDCPGHRSIVDLASLYHNLMRGWCEI